MFTPNVVIVRSFDFLKSFSNTLWLTRVTINSLNYISSRYRLNVETQHFCFGIRAYFICFRPIWPGGGGLAQRWKKLHAARADILSWIEDILVWKSAVLLHLFACGKETATELRILSRINSYLFPGWGIFIKKNEDCGVRSKA